MNESVRASINETLTHSRNRLKQVEETIRFTQQNLSALFAEENMLTRKIVDLEKFLSVVDLDSHSSDDPVSPLAGP